MIALGTKFIQSQKENDNKRVSEKELEFNMQTKFVSWALEMVSQKSGRNGINLMNQF